ncbi:hypothetical protein D3C73_1594800 [compost metagenome]
MMAPNTSPDLIMSRILALTSQHITLMFFLVSTLACAAPSAELASGMNSAPRFGLACARLSTAW